MARKEDIQEDARVNKHSYPVMSESEVAEQVQTMFPERLTGLDMNLRNPDLVHLVMSLFVEVLLGVSAEEQTMLPLSVLTRYTRHPEMHSNTRYHFFVLVQRLAARACLSVSLTHNDFANPTTRRWLNVFSGLINFFKHAMNMRTKQSEIRRGRQAVLDERDRLQRQIADLRRKRADDECRRVERELQTKAMQRDAREKAVANRGLAERLAAQRAVIDEQRRRWAEAAAGKEEAMRLKKVAEDRLALVRYEVVETPVHQIEAELLQLEASVERQNELSRQRTSRHSELQRLNANLQRSQSALDDFLVSMDREDEGRARVATAVTEIARQERENSERGEEVAALRGVNSRREQSERQDILYRLKLMEEGMYKQHEELRQKMKSDSVVMQADLKTMEARTVTYGEQLEDLQRRLDVMEQQRSRRLYQIEWTVRNGRESLRDFQGRAKTTLMRFLK